MNRLVVLCAALAISTAALGCSNQKPQPEYASSAHLSTYAERYPDALQKSRATYENIDTSTEERFTTMSEFPAQLPEVDGTLADKAIELADAAGRTGQYAKARKSASTVFQFFDEEKEEINKKVGGAAQYTLKRNNCKGDAFSPVSAALDKSVEKQVQERLDASNEGAVFVDQHAEELGKENTETLKQQTAFVADTSFLIHVALPKLKVRMTEQVAEAGDVKSTLTKSIDEATKRAADSSLTEKQRSDAEARRVDLTQKRDGIDDQVKQLQAQIDAMDDRLKILKSKYDEALKTLREALASKQPKAA